ncbi:7161_t:CDS:2, partial [Dentiscutata erythropus]
KKAASELDKQKTQPSESCTLYSKQKTVSQYMIQAKARTLCTTSQYQEKYGEIQNNKFSQKWVDRFIFGRRIEKQNDDEDNDENNSKNTDESDGEPESKNNVDGEDMNKNESGLVYDDYYEESEDLTVIQDWN